MAIVRTHNKVVLAAIEEAALKAHEARGAVSWDDKPKLVRAGAVLINAATTASAAWYEEASRATDDETRETACLVAGSWVSVVEDEVAQYKKLIGEI